MLRTRPGVEGWFGVTGTGTGPARLKRGGVRARGLEGRSAWWVYVALPCPARVMRFLSLSLCLLLQLLLFLLLLMVGGYCRSAMDGWASRIRMRLMDGLAGPGYEKVQALAWRLVISTSNSRGFTVHWQFHVVLSY